MEVEEKIAVALHPPKCPKCGKEIHTLKYAAYELVASLLEVNIEGKPSWSVMEILGFTKDGSIEYRCPACNAVLFHDDDSAISYLKGDGW